MCSRDVVVKNSVGLHARPASFFTQKASEYRSLIWLEKGELKVNAKSLLSVLSLGVMGGGVSVRIVADGDDEDEAVDALAKLIEKNFNRV